MVTFAQANSEDERRQAFRLRYQVYCIERGFEDAAAFPSGQERDGWDAVSWHFLCRREDGRAVGTVRLVPPTTHALPLERRCHITSPDYWRIRPFAGEISRLAITRAFDRREEGWPTLPVPLLGLVRAVYQKCVEQGLTHILAVMDRSLHLLLRRHGLNFVPIGPPVDYHGTRTPYALSGYDLERDCPRKRPDVFAFMREGMPEGFDVTSLSLGPGAGRPT